MNSVFDFCVGGGLDKLLVKLLWVAGGVKLFVKLLWVTGWGKIVCNIFVGGGAG